MRNNISPGVRDTKERFFFTYMDEPNTYKYTYVIFRPTACVETDENVTGTRRYAVVQCVRQTERKRISATKRRIDKGKGSAYCAFTLATYGDLNGLRDGKGSRRSRLVLVVLTRNQY